MKLICIFFHVIFVGKVEDIDIALVSATKTTGTPIVVEEPKANIEAQAMKMNNKAIIHEDDNILIEDIIKEEIVDYTIEEPLEEKERVGNEPEMDVDMLNVDHIKTIEHVNEDFNNTKVTELAQLQGIHALVDDTIMLSSKTKP
jgi:hypothetical protein